MVLMGMLQPAYQNLRNRVDQNVSAYLSKITWRPTLNKNQLRNQLRKYVQVYKWLFRPTLRY